MPSTRSGNIAFVLAVSIVTIGFFVWFHPVQARGTLVKGSLPAVYYLASDGARYVFPNERIYFSWYPDFSTVSTISDDRLASYPLGGNVTYRAGTRLVKIMSDPKVYAVEAGGVLHWITTEAIAKQLYGMDWVKQVDDIPDGFFPAYVIGNSIASTRYPDGTLLQDQGLYYVIWDGMRRLITDAGMKANGLQTSFAVPSPEDGTGLEGSDVSGEAAFLSDTAQLGLGASQEPAVTVSTGANPDTILQGIANQPIGTFTFSFRERTTLSRLTAKIQALTSADSDTDPGGLVRGNGTELLEANFTQLLFLDADGRQRLSAGNLQIDRTLDGTQTLSFGGTETFEPGRHTLRLMATTSDEAPAEERYQATLQLADSRFEIGAGTTTEVTPSALSASQVTMKPAALVIELTGGQESRSLLKGATGPQKAVSFSFVNPLSAPAEIRSMTLTGFIDKNEGNADFTAGSDEDSDAVFTFVRDVVSSVTIVDEVSGATLATSSLIQSDGRVLFEPVVWSVPAGETLVLGVYVTLNPAAPFGLRSDRIAFDIVNPEDHLEAHTFKNGEIDVEGASVNGGTRPLVYLNVAESGTMTIRGSGAAQPRLLMKSTDNQLYTLTFTATDEEAIDIDTLVMRLSDPTVVGSVKAVTLQWKEGGVIMRKTGDVSVGNVIFRDLGLTVPRDNKLDAYVLVDINASAGGAVSGHRIGFAFEPALFSAHGLVSGYRFDNNDFGKRLTNTTTLGNASPVRKNQPTVTKSAEQPDIQQRESEVNEMLRFNIRYTGEGHSKITRLTFKIVTTDMEDDNDDLVLNNELLEVLAGVNGDAADDNDIVELVDLEENEIVGEGSSGHVDYSVYDASARTIDDTPQGIEIGRNDYGLVTYEFTTPLVTSTVDREYAFSLRTLGIAPGIQHVTVSLLGVTDFGWSDGTRDGGNETGNGVSTLPIVGPAIEFF